MSRTQPTVGFVSLGCPKALVDSERILTQLRIEGYEVGEVATRTGKSKRTVERLLQEFRTRAAEILGEGPGDD